jgi:TolA-binding protein
MSNMETMQQRLEQLESKLTQQVVQADPQAAAPKSGETQSDWLQRLLDEGEEVNPKLVEQIRSLENKLDQMNQSVQMHNQRWQNVEWAQANAAYDQNMAKLQSYCPKWDEERLTTMIANGVTPRMVVAMYRDVYGDAPSQQAPAQVAQVQRAAPPRIDGPSNSTPNIGNETMTKENYLKWVRGEFNNKMH